MITMKQALWGAGVVVVLVLGISIGYKPTPPPQVAEADQAHTAAVVAVAQATIHDDTAEKQKAKLLASAKEVARLKADVEALRAKLKEPVPSGEPVDLSPLVESQDLLIKGLEEENAGLKTQVVTLTLSRDAWKKAHDESAKEAALMRIAYDAQVASLKAQRWQGRIEGFLIGLGTGYVTGKLL